MSTARTTDDAFQDVLLALFRLHGQVLHAADVMSADAGLSGARWQVMKVVARRPMTVSQVARRLGLQRQSVQRTVDGLREALAMIGYQVERTGEFDEPLAAVVRAFQRRWRPLVVTGEGDVETVARAFAVAQLTQAAELQR